MKLLLSFLLIIGSMGLMAADKTPDSHGFTTLEMVFENHKKQPNKAIKGPFLLKIQSVTESGINTHLNTETDPKNPKNIAVVMPPFVKNHYQKQYKSNLSALFLNGKLVINGVLQWQQPKTQPKSEKAEIEIDAVATIRLFSNNQLAHYD